MKHLELPRGRRGTAAVLVAVVGLVICVVLAIDAFYLDQTGRSKLLNANRIARIGRDNTVSQIWVLVVAVVIAVIGLFLLGAALVPPRRRLVRLSGDEDIVIGIDPTGVRRLLSAAASRVDGVDRTRIALGRRVTVRASTDLRNVDRLPDLVRQRVSDRLSDLDPDASREVQVKLVRKED